MIFSSISQDLYNKNILQEAHLGIKELPDFSIRILRLFMHQHMLSGKVLYSHQTIANLIGYSVSTVRRSLSHLRSLGFIKWQQRCNKSCLYFVNANLFIKSNLKRIQQFFITYFRCILPESLRSPKQSPECDKSKNEQLSKFKGILNMVFSHLSNKVKEVNPDDPFGDRTTEPPVFKKTELKQDSDSDYPLRDSTISAIEKVLPLTEHGKIKLRQYPSLALRTAQKEIAIVLKRENPFIYLLRICEEYCKQHNLYVERSKYNHLCYRNGIDPKDNNFYDKEMFEQAKKSKIRGAPISASGSPTRRAETRSASYVIWKPENNRTQENIPKDLSFLQNVSVVDSGAKSFIDILLGKKRVV